MKIRIQLAGIVVVMALGPSLLPAASHSKKDKDKEKDKDSEYIEGDLTVQGDAHLESSLDLGTTGTSQSAMLFQYSEANANYTFSLSATRPATVFLWQDNAIGTMKNKMKLDANNVLSLFGGNGTAGIVFDPNTGGITLAGTGSGITLSDGTTLSNAASLHSTALYDTGGNARMTFDGSGNLVVSVPVVMQGTAIDFGSGNALNPSNVAYLKQTLANLGYREPGVPRDPSFGAVTLGGGASTGEYSFSAGIGTQASGYASTALGESTNAIGRGSTAFGQSTQATGSFSMATGEQTKANSYASLVLGRNNAGSFASGGDATWIATDPVLEIGNGEASGGIPSNAMTVLKNGELRTEGVIQSKAGVRVPPQGDLSMGDFTAGNNPADLDPTSGLKYQGE